MMDRAGMDDVCYRPIGVIRSPFPDPVGMPVQAVGAVGVAGVIEVLPEFAAGLRDIVGFSHLILLYHLHLARGHALTVTPFLDDQPHGIFATRSPARPNPLGLSVVRLTGVAGTVLHIADVDIVDGTPLLDIKPYVPPFDSRETARIGWYAGKIARVGATRADDRFAGPS